MLTSTWRLLLVVVMITSSTVQSQTMQSSLKLPSAGIDFLPANPVELIADFTDISSFMSCYIACNINPLCRTFVSDSTVPFICRLYQGSIETGDIITASSSTTRVAGLLYNPSLYLAYNQVCDPQMPPFDRYLVCINQLWQCPTATFWNGFMCLNQLYYEDLCIANETCRQDIGLQCSSSCGKCICNSTASWNSTTCVQSTGPTLTPHDSTLTALWPLNGDAHDLINGINGTLMGNATFISGYIGQVIQCSHNVYIKIPYIDFYLRSFTVELWFYRTYFNNTAASLFGECENYLADRCLHYGIFQDSSLQMGFFYDDSQGLTTILSNQWYHVAFVYDYPRRQRLIYVNGIAIVMKPHYAPTFVYLGQSGYVSICQTALPQFPSFQGYIDQVSITHRAKTANEILDDASLIVYYSFDYGSTLDSGPNLLHGFANGETSVIGRINDAVLFNSSSAYFQMPPFLTFGIANQSFSISLWIKPLNLSGILVHISNQSTGNGWCVPLLGFNSLGGLLAQVPFSNVIGPVLGVNVWTHVVQTFSITNGLRLYINRALSVSSMVTTVSAPYQQMYVTVASYRSGGSSCMWEAIDRGPYAGAIDELRIYNREITATDVCILAS